MEDPDAALALLRSHVRAGDLDGARRLVIPGRHGERGALSIALAERRREDAVALARGLADSGWWDPEVAATIVEHGGSDHPLARRATSIVAAVTLARMRTVEEVGAMLRDALAAGAVLEAFLAAEEAIRRWPDQVELWGVVALTRLELGDTGGAKEAVRRALSFDAKHVTITLVAAHLAAMTDRDALDARAREARADGIEGEVADAYARAIEVGAVWGAVLDAVRGSR